MKVFITRKEEENEYAITKVSDHLVADFERDNDGKIVLKGNSIQDVMIKYAALDKEPGISFNPELVKLKGDQLKKETEKDDNRREVSRHKMRIKK